ncbi:uncharacterized protein BT62DRAFT_569272 [Guyanagaster necrorhizus]|uniref:Uncharacterized protein n=1 Tax=Guyanagaster necrorhizus TaxID=856835 RepID=A0A9P7VIM5_9AGAR|nr:uncharacterized protein BT62DRAFT_569272 [Guyanagaster necrorhizus MCA 3950]KAG7440726.1 hypothetical protein BT62DRAFT_569272 [Guyanagaster necrorhizus MCA 3950]
MMTCPRISRTWKAVYVPIASQDIYILSPAYIYYLSDIAGRQKSIIYHDLIPRLTHLLSTGPCGWLLNDPTVRRWSKSPLPFDLSNMQSCRIEVPGHFPLLLGI